MAAKALGKINGKQWLNQELVMHVGDVLTSQPDPCHLRSKNKLNLPFWKSNIGWNGLFYLRPKIWSSLHSELKSGTNLNSFNNKIKEKIFEDPQNLQM